MSSSPKYVPVLHLYKDDVGVTLVGDAMRASVGMSMDSPAVRLCITPSSGRRRSLDDEPVLGTLGMALVAEAFARVDDHALDLVMGASSSRTV